MSLPEDIDTMARDLNSAVRAARRREHLDVVCKPLCGCCDVDDRECIMRQATCHNRGDTIVVYGVFGLMGLILLTLFVVCVYKLLTM